MPTLNARPRPCRRTRLRCAGFTLVEMMIALFVFGMMISLFGALVPIADQGSRSGSGYAQAALLAQHKIDQVRQGGFSKLNAGQMVTMGIIDANANGTPMTTATPAGLPAGATSYSFTGVDNLVDSGANKGYFPAGAQGVLSLSPPSASRVGARRRPPRRCK